MASTKGVFILPVVTPRRSPRLHVAARNIDSLHVHVPLAERNSCEMDSPIKTRSVLCLEVSRTIKSNQEALL